MTIDSTHSRFGPAMNLDYSHHQPPAFTNPWPSASPPHAGQAPGTGLAHQHHASPSHQMPPINPGVMMGKNTAGRTSTSSGSSMGSYGSMPVPTSSADLMNMSRMTTSAAYADPAYTTASPVSGHFAPSSAPYDTMGYAAAAPVRQPGFSLGHDASASRRFSQPSVNAMGMREPLDTPRAQHPSRSSLVDFDHRSIQDERRGFADALDASHGMLAMSQETPRNIYGSRSDRSSVDSYGFPSTHSTSSSVSSSGNFSSYYGDSVSDYSTAGSDIESVNSRTLPRPQGLMGSSMPPAPQSMMGQFSSKVSSSTQKKHKCKVCDKRFTRPSSLQTHMYSHTGEKPFACDVEGCGRHFSVVSNLRRHRKVHRGDAPSEAGSEDHHSD
jgi:hypothetical protein